MPLSATSADRMSAGEPVSAGGGAGPFASQHAVRVGIPLHHRHEARPSLRVAAHGHFYPHQNQVLGFLVFVHLAALAYWVYAFLKSRKEKARRVREPPRSVNCTYEWATIPKELSHIRPKPLTSQGSLDSGATPPSALRTPRTPWYPKPDAVQD